jgi:hypothetical protein
LIDSSLTPAVLQYLYLLKLNPNVSVIYVPTNTSIIVSPPAVTGNVTK